MQHKSRALVPGNGSVIPVGDSMQRGAGCSTDFTFETRKQGHDHINSKLFFRSTNKHANYHIYTYNYIYKYL